ncbi:hypothetical protein LEN26_009774 [Aphanomyces euteiches]|nr:hypothetical protein AeMF1_017239 [Aphanomyces euteiches]KAH9124043.1 hypothetical protein LEN26_009774 [Aphanomyces euteiches]KAH9191666.1 hypothetical protein AeNC1_006345 [Aphanomyces euteiches]
MDRFYDSISSAIRDYQLDESRIFNVDETVFDSRNKSQKVLALRGAKTVWSKSISTSFHLSIVVCGNAAGKHCTTDIYFSGSELYRGLEACDAIEGSTITTSNMGIITEQLFYNWIGWSSSQVGSDIERPILLIMDKYGNYISQRSFNKCKQLQVVLLIHPENATHLVQPLDICVFAPFKRAIRDGIFDFMIDNDEASTIP